MVMRVRFEDVEIFCDGAFKRPGGVGVCNLEAPSYRLRHATHFHFRQLAVQHVPQQHAVEALEWSHDKAFHVRG